MYVASVRLGSTVRENVKLLIGQSIRLIVASLVNLNTNQRRMEKDMEMLSRDDQPS